ncbi:MAG: molecular chaperone HtpG [Clostridia bacterium]|nr:molecular chaperone HtpG [Clostridia bacterium]
MSKKEFKAESKRLMDLMINSIYTNKEIFLRELISNASDAIDKLHYRSLTDKNLNINVDELQIEIELDKKERTLTIKDNGSGMTKEELEENLGTIAKSGSLKFKEENEKKEDIDIIGQFGVGFYSCFMVSRNVKVISKSIDSEEAYIWESEGIDGYSVEPTKKEIRGTTIILKLKEDTEDEKYSRFLEEYEIQELIKKYSDYIRYPIKMEMEHQRKKEGTENEFEKVKEIETVNSRIPLWKRPKKDIKQDEYDSFYVDKFHDYEKPLKVIHTKVEGQYSYNALLYIPSHVPFDYYTSDYEKGLQLYSNGVLIIEKCEELLPDYFGFVKGLVDSEDLSLNISREILQQDRQLKTIAKNIESKIKSELQLCLEKDREEYEKFFNIFGVQLKFGTYNNYGMNKELLQDLLLFHCSEEGKYITLKEYVKDLKQGQDSIYYACGETIDKIEMLPQVEKVKDKGFKILYLTDNVDEFVLQVIMEYEGKKFVNVSANNVDLDTEEEKQELKKVNEENKEMFNLMKETLKDCVQDIRFTHRLKNHPVCLSSEGAISIEMEKVMKEMPTGQGIKAQTVLEINEKHEIANKIKELYKNDKEELKKYTKILYAGARLIEGLTVDNPTEISNLICDILAK